MTLYILKLFGCSAVFFGYYFFFLRNKRFHHYNRFYLLSATGLSFIIPFIKIPLMFEAGGGNQVYRTLSVISSNFSEADSFGGEPSPLMTPLFSVQLFTWIFYVTGVIILSVILFRSFISIRNISKKYPYQVWQGVRLYNTPEEGTPFSFLRSVYWNDRIDMNSPEGQQILRHEMFHVRQQHTLDIIFMEFVCIIGWFNPFFYFIRKEIRAIHEFLADQYAVSGYDECEYAELLVLQSIASQHSSVAHPFFNNHIKRRITMLTNFSTNRYGYWSRIMILPLAAVLFCFFTVYASPFQQPGSKHIKKGFTIVVDAGHGGIDPGAMTESGITEKDLNLQLSGKIQELAPEYNIIVVMTRDRDALPGDENTSREDALKERVRIAKKAKADLFISIHVNASSALPAKKGFDIYVPPVISKNKYGEQSRLAGTSVLKSLSETYTTSDNLLTRENQGVFVLNRSACPAILIECGNMYNDDDLKLITDKRKQSEIARKILDGIAKYASVLSLTGDNESSQKRLDTAPAEKNNDLVYIIDPLKTSYKEFYAASKKFSDHGYQLNFNKDTSASDLLKVSLNDPGIRAASATFRMNELREIGFVIVVSAQREGLGQKFGVRSEPRDNYQALEDRYPVE